MCSSDLSIHCVAMCGSLAGSLAIAGRSSVRPARLIGAAIALNAGRVSTYALLGAIAGAVGLGLHRDHASAVAAMTRLGQTFEPVPAHAQRYEALYQRVYKRMYEPLRPLYAELQDILHPH